jgi:hypothetical protein
MFRGFLASDLGTLARGLVKQALPDGQIPPDAKRALFQAVATNPNTRNYILGETAEQKTRNLERFFNAIDGRTDLEKANTLLRLAEVAIRFERKNREAARALLTMAVSGSGNGGYIFAVPATQKYQAQELLRYLRNSPVVREILGSDERLGIDDIYPTLRGLAIAVGNYLQRNNDLPRLPGFDPDSMLSPSQLFLARAFGIFAKAGAGLSRNDHQGRGLVGAQVARVNRQIDEGARQLGEQLGRAAGLDGEVSLSSAAPRQFSMGDIRGTMLDLKRFDDFIRSSLKTTPSALDELPPIEHPPQLRFGGGIPVYDLASSAQDFLQGDFPRTITHFWAEPGQDRIVVEFRSGYRAALQL